MKTQESPLTAITFDNDFPELQTAYVKQQDARLGTQAIQSDAGTPWTMNSVEMPAGNRDFKVNESEHRNWPENLKSKYFNVVAGLSPEAADVTPERVDELLGDVQRYLDNAHGLNWHTSITFEVKSEQPRVARFPWLGAKTTWTRVPPAEVGAYVEAGQKVRAHSKGVGIVQEVLDVEFTGMRHLGHFLATKAPRLTKGQLEQRKKDHALIADYDDDMSHTLLNP